MSIVGLPSSNQLNGRRHSSETPNGGAATRAVLLLNLGTPDAPRPREVRRYLAEFLSDPEVIRLPPRMRWFTPVLGRMIALFRAKQSAHAYSTIWTDEGSPLLVITNRQVEALQQIMPKGWRVYAAMRYGNPSVSDVLDRMIADGVEELTVVPMYPQYSGPTTGTAMDDLYRQLNKRGQQLSLTVRNQWHDDIGYVDAQAELLRQFILERNLHPKDCVLMFSAHSMPESYIRDGDPYQQQIIESAKHITERLGWPAERAMIAYQSKLGPVPWLSPSTEGALQELAKDGEPNVIVCPISFTADCLESIEEVGVTYREMFEESGGALHLCPALNTFDPFIKSLMQLVMRGPKSIAQSNNKRPPLIEFPEEPVDEAEPVGDPLADVDRLLMVGVSLEPRLGQGEGPDVRYVTPEQFKGVKRPQEEVAELLNELRQSGLFTECWLWNTCSRFEFYGWMNADYQTSDADQAIARTIRMVMGEANEAIEPGVLHGRDALHHLLRTSIGLNSGLPGDGEIYVQLRSAQRIAEHAGSLGPKSDRLIDRIIEMQDELSSATRWSRFRPEYCPVAMKRAALQLEHEWTGLSYVVIGGSVTASSVIDALQEHFGVDSRRITAIHRTRSRGVQIKRLKKALHKGDRITVDQYSDQPVLDAIAKADVVFFTTDSRTPLIDGDTIAGLRNLEERPMTIVDFNTFDSTEGVERIESITLITAADLENEIQHFADGLLNCPAFRAARDCVERAIQCSLRGDHVLLTLPTNCRASKGEPCSAQHDDDHSVNGAHHHHDHHDLNGHHSNGHAHEHVHDANGKRVCPCPRHSALSTCPERLIKERIGS